VDEDKPNCAMVVPGEGMTMLNLNADCHREIVAKELIEGFEFEPKCLVLVLAMENEQEMFNSMLSSGRIMTDPFEIRVWYTVATGDHPDAKLASTNCHNSKLLKENYLLDTTGQAELTALEGWRANVTKFSKLVELTERMQGYLPMGTWDEDGFFRLNPPSPPMQPGQQTIDDLIKDYKEQLVINQALVDLTVEKYSECFVADRSDETVCGLSANEVPSATNRLLSSVCTPSAPPRSMCRRPTRGSLSTTSSAAATPRSRRARRTTADVRASRCT